MRIDNEAFATLIGDAAMADEHDLHCAGAHDALEGRNCTCANKVSEVPRPTLEQIRAALFAASAAEPDEPLIHGPSGTAWIKFSTAEKAIAAITQPQT